MLNPKSELQFARWRKCHYEFLKAAEITARNIDETSSDFFSD